MEPQAPIAKTPQNDAEKVGADREPSQTDADVRDQRVSNVSNMVQGAMLALVSGDAGAALKILHDVRQALSALLTRPG
ncbi:MAG: hypothetical protein AB2A00_25865 [Myxococcota bacterium]